MKVTLGKIGIIKKIYADKDLKIEVCECTFTYNPLCVEHKKFNENIYNSNKMNEDLIKAAANGDIKEIKKLLESGLNVNVLLNGQSALHAAAQNGHLDIVKVLLDCGADIEMPDKDGKLMSKFSFYLIEFGTDSLNSTPRFSLPSKNCRTRTQKR